MCLIALALDAHPDYRLVLAANRDEFHHRPSAPASFWDDAPQIFGGRDLQGHGTWLAMTVGGRWAAVTNVRRMIPPDPNAPSRGHLVAGFLRSNRSIPEYAEHLHADADRYAGFNLLLGDADGAWYLSNQQDFEHQRLNSGIHAVSNAALDTPWPKLRRLRARMESWCQAPGTSTDALMQALADPYTAEDKDLPDTGVGLEMERFLAPPFIRGDQYGTRASTVLTIGHDGVARFHEHRWGPNGVAIGETRETLSSRQKSA